MSFSQITKVEKYQFYVDLALSRAKKEVLEYKTTLKGIDNLYKITKCEERRISIINQNISKPLERIMKEFPSIDNLSEFYKELIKIEIGIVELKKALATIRWTVDKAREFSKVYAGKISKSTDLRVIQKHKNDYIGRASSLLKRNKEIFVYLDECRVILERFPSIKEGLYTVSIAGFPNVGKSTLLSKLTTSKPKIENYAFTTRSLLTGYDSTTSHKIQFVDTPGTLNRADSENHIERMSYCAIKYACDLIIFVFDPLQYDYNTQEKLLKRFSEYGKDMIIFVSKSDICPKETADLVSRLSAQKSDLGILDVFDDKEKLQLTLHKMAKGFMK